MAVIRERYIGRRKRESEVLELDQEFPYNRERFGELFTPTHHNGTLTVVSEDSVSVATVHSQTGHKSSDHYVKEEINKRELMYVVPAKRWHKIPIGRGRTDIYRWVDSTTPS